MKYVLTLLLLASWLSADESERSKVEADLKSVQSDISALEAQLDKLDWFPGCGVDGYQIALRVRQIEPRLHSDDSALTADDVSFYFAALDWIHSQAEITARKMPVFHDLTKRIEQAQHHELTLLNRLAVLGALDKAREL